MSRIEYRPPAPAAGVEILVHQGVIDGGQFKKLFGVPIIVLPNTFFGQLSGLKYFIPYSFTLETSDVAVPVAVSILLKFPSITDSLTQVKPDVTGSLYTCGIIPFAGSNHFNDNNLLGIDDLVLTATVNSPLADYGDAKYTLLYSLITIV
jgi:hypothetical protein